MNKTMMKITLTNNGQTILTGFNTDLRLKTDKQLWKHKPTEHRSMRKPRKPWRTTEDRTVSAYTVIRR